MKLKAVLFTTVIFTAIFASQLAFSSINPSDFKDPQMVNINIQIKGKNKIFSSDLAMPYYQTAELEKKVDNKNYMFEVNPKHGKNPGEVDIEVRLFNKKGSKVIAKKEITTKYNHETVVSMKGVMFKVTPTI